MEQNQIVLRKEDFVEKDGIFFMPMRELAKRLGYSHSRQLWKVFNRNKEELSQYSGVVNLTTPGGRQDVLCLNELGCYTIAMLANTEKAKQFRKALAKLIMDIRTNEKFLVSKENVERLEKELGGWKREMYKIKKELFIRKTKKLNFTNAAIIDKFLEKNFKIKDIIELTELNPNTVRNYMRLSLAAKVAVEKETAFIFTSMETYMLSGKSGYKHLGEI